MLTSLRNVNSMDEKIWLYQFYSWEGLWYVNLLYLRYMFSKIFNMETIIRYKPCPLINLFQLFERSYVDQCHITRPISAIESWFLSPKLIWVVVDIFDFPWQTSFGPHKDDNSPMLYYILDIDSMTVLSTLQCQLE